MNIEEKKCIVQGLTMSVKGGRARCLVVIQGNIRIDKD